MKRETVSGENVAERSEEMTIDALARHADLPVSTVRMYQNKGLLPPGERRGRVSFYGHEHRERLRLITHLQQRGFSLAAIHEALEAWARGRSLDRLLGIGTIASGLSRPPVRLSLGELAELFDGVEVTQADLVAAANAGLMELDGTHIVVDQPAFVDIGPAVARSGVPLSVIVSEYAATRDAVATLAGRFRAVFEDHIWEPFMASGMPEGQAGEVIEQASELAELVAAVVQIELARNFESFVSEYSQQAQHDSSNRSG